MMSPVVRGFAYDDVPYDSEANAHAHPRALGTLARLFGLNPAPASRCRALEIGCGNAENLIAAATYLPHAELVGFDLAERAIAQGREAARASGATNVRLEHRDVRDAAGPDEAGAFDYVVAHGVYSWVPEAIRGAVLATVRNALRPSGVAFVSVNALPGWEMRRALRGIVRSATASVGEANAKVATALAVIEELGRGREGGFTGALGVAAREYIEHVRSATPPDAPFNRYVFHDLLAECNDPFSVGELDVRLARAGLRLLCETPLRAERERAFEGVPRGAESARARPALEGLTAAMAWSGTPFLQVLACRDDAATRDAPDARALLDTVMWADLARRPGGVLRTTTGHDLRLEHATAELRAVLERAAAHAPGFVPVRDLVAELDGEAAERVARELLSGTLRGALTLVDEAPPCVSTLSETPRVAAHVLRRAREATAARAVLTSALHRSFAVPRDELALLRQLDGASTAPEIAARAGVDAERGRVVLDRFLRHAFLVG